MRAVVTAVTVAAMLMCAPSMSWAANQTGNGTNGNQGGGHGGNGAGNQGNGGSNGNAGGSNGSGGGNGGSSPSVNAPAAVSAPSGGESAGALTQGYVQDQTGPVSGGALLNRSQAQTETDIKAALAEAGHSGLVQVGRINVDGSFTYGGYEWAMAAFAREMQARGYDMGFMGQPSTNFGSPEVIEQVGG